MVDKSETGREDVAPARWGASVDMSDANAWFVREVLPLEAALIQFLHHNWRNEADIEDLLQDIYVRVHDAARKQIPDSAKSFVFATARHLLVDRVRHERIVPIEAVADLDTLGIARDEPGPDRLAIARDELRRLQVALDRLPPRCREAIVLRQIEGLSRREIAARMGIGPGTVKEYVAEGVRALADMFYSEPADLRRRP